MPDLHAIATLAITAGAFWLYTRPWIRIEMVSVLLLLALLVIFHFFPFETRGARLTEVEVFAAFGHPALVAICCLMVMARGLTVTGALEPVVRLLARLWRLSPTLGLLLTLLCAGGASAVINDTPVLVLLLPLLLGLARRMGTGAARTLMPVNFAILAGGTLTAIGTSTNILVLNIAGDLGMAPMGVFDFTSIAAVGFAVAVTYLWLVAPRLLPAGEAPAGGAERRFAARVALRPGDTRLVDRSLARAARALGGALPVTSVLRDGAVLQPADDLVLAAGDTLVLDDTPDGLRDFAATFGVGLMADPDALRDGARLAELVVGSECALAGRRIRELDLAAEYGVQLVGRDNGSPDLLQRHRDAEDARLAVGDVLLVQGDAGRIDALRSVPGLLVLDATRELPRTPKAPLAILILLSVVTLSATQLLPIHVAAFGGMVAMILGGCIRFEGLADALSLEVVLLVASSIALGQSLVVTGAAGWLAGGLGVAVDSLPAALQLALFMGFAALLTNFVSNAAAATIGTPIAVETARVLGLPVEPFVLAILFGANLSFATPMAYQTNVLIMKAAGYRFADFVRVGVPLVILMLVVLAWMLVRHYGL